MKNLLDLLLNVALLQSILALLTLISPNIRMFLLENFYYEHYVIGRFSHLTANRIFGFTLGFTYAMPVVQGFMAFIAFMYSIHKSIKYIIYIPFLLLSAAINARVGIIVFFAAIFVYGILNLSSINIRSIKKISIVLILLVIGLVISISFIGVQSEVTSKWIIDSLYETKAFFLGERVGYFSVLDSFLFFPKGFDLIYGTGRDYFFSSHPVYESSSDIGYVNDLFQGGIIFVLLLYLSFFILYLSWKSKTRIEYSVIPVVLLVLVLILNVKGFSFKFNEFTNLFILISVFSITDISGIMKKKA